LPKKSHFNDFELSFDFPGIGQKTMAINGRQIKLHGKDSPLILLVIDDITKRKKAEDILKRDNSALDKIIGERTRELLRLQLELINSRHLSAIGTLAATVAHELRNPLTDIALLAHRIKKISNDPQIESILAGIKARVSESDQIINNILIYSKSTIAHYASVKINDILKGAVGHEAQKFPIGKISIKEKIDCTEDLSIEADPVRIKEVFHNILLNAFEAVDADTGVIEIESELRGGMVAISIKDNGVGIARKDLKNISSPFFTTKAKGTGLGLALCKQVILLHGGSMAIKSIRGKGTTVTVNLPIHKHKDA
jgi:two-component system sensor histidine kinase HydH